MKDASADFPSGVPADKRWLAEYPAGVPTSLQTDLYAALPNLFEESFERNARFTAYTCMGKHLTYAQLDQKSRAMAAYLQSLGLEKGDRVAVMLPNILQSPIAVAGVLRAGFVVVNVNPLYTPRELRHQLIDSGAKAIVILENFGHVLQEVIADTDVTHVVTTSLGDLLGVAKGAMVNLVVRKVKKMVPAYQLTGAVRFKRALKIGAASSFTKPQIGPDDIAVLQYTGGTTGVAKGAMLLHKTLVGALLGAEAWLDAAFRARPVNGQITYICALPLYHVFAFVNCSLLGIRKGGRSILIPNARDIPAMVKAMQGEKFHVLPAVNTLFAALLKNPDFHKLDFSQLRISNGGGMAVMEATARKWRDVTGCPIAEGYGLTETSSGICCNRCDIYDFNGTVGLPMPGSEIRILDDEGGETPTGEPGEIAIRGVAVMAGYWRRPEATAEVMTTDGFFRSGDIGVMDEKGYVRVVDRKKDMILVSGFNVYPNEIEDVVMNAEGVQECAAVGVPDPTTGEAIRLYIVGDGVDENTLKAHCRDQLVPYKCPKQIVFTDDLPKTNVGKILRRELRDRARAEVAAG